MINFDFLKNEDLTVEAIRESMTPIVNEVSNLESELETTKNELEKVKEINISLYSKLTTTENEENEENEDNEENITLSELFE